MANAQESVSEQLSAAIVAAFPGYVEQRLQQMGIVKDAMLDDVIAAASDRLETQLGSLGEAPLTESPLETVRIATEAVTAALLEKGTAPVMRDTRADELHPDDVYDLYPATSRDLGEAVWQAHMKWGIERARLVAGVVPAPSPPAQTAAPGPSVALFGFSDPTRSAVAEAVRAVGYRPLLWRNPAALDSGLAVSPALVLVDLGHPAAEDAIRVAAATSTVVAVGDGVDDLTQAAMMSLGAEDVIVSNSIVERLPGLLPRLA